MPFHSQEKHKSLASPFAKASGQPWLVRAESGWYNLPLIIAMTVTVFFRHHFGERYLSPKSLWVGTIPLALFAAAMRFVAGDGSIDGRAPVPTSSWVAWLAYCLFFLSYVTVQLFVGLNRRSALSDEYSYSGGRPREILLRFMPLVHDAWDFERFYEPVVCIAIGSLLAYFHVWFGVYIIIAGCCAFSVARTKYKTRRDLELNTLDSKTQESALPVLDKPERPRLQPIRTRPEDGETKDQA